VIPRQYKALRAVDEIGTVDDTRIAPTMYRTEIGLPQRLGDDNTFRQFGARRECCARYFGTPRPIAASDSIHRRPLALKEAGIAILLVSADLDEIRALADRILVMEGGRIARAIGRTARERELGLLMGGGLPR
jgi:hypothetical protein